MPILKALDSILARLPITYGLIALNVLVSLVGFWALRTTRYRRYFVFIPSGRNPARNPVGAVLSHFSHGDFGHLFLNLLALYFFGPRVEKILGPTAYLIVYVVSGVVGTVFVWIFHRNNPRYAALGASGSIAGVLFALVVTAPTTSLFVLFVPVAIPAPIFAVLYLLLSSVKMGGGDGVAHEAHLGGALAGFACAGLLYARGFDPLIRALQSLIG